MDVSSLFASVLTGAAALGGVYLSNSMKGRDDRDARIDAVKRERAKITVEKSEDVYVILDRLRAAILDIFDTDRKYVMGKIDISDRNKLHDSISFDVKDEMPRCRFILEVYLPRAARKFDEMRENVGIALKKCEEIVNKKNAGLDITNSEISEFKQIRDDVSDEIWKLCTLVAQEVANT